MAVSEAVDSLPPDSFRDEIWVELMPWLADYPPGTLIELTTLSPAVDWWLTESPAVSSTVVSFSELRRALAQLVISDRPAASFSELMPGLPRSIPVAALRVSTRAMTTLQRLPVETVGELADVTVTRLFDVRGTGIGTVQELVESLVTITTVIRPAAPSGLTSINHEPTRLLPAAELQLLDDLRQLARWRRLRGESAAPLLGVYNVEDTAPEEIQDLASRLRAVTAVDLLLTAATDPFQELSELADSLDERQLTVVRNRLLAAVPQTLADLGESFGISRERVRQIESAVRDRMSSSFVFGTAVGDLLASLRVEIQPVSSLERLLGRHPELALEVRAFGVPLWLVLDRLDDYFEVTEGWAAAPDVAHARDQTRSLLEDYQNENGLVDLSVLQSGTRMPAEELRRWLEGCGYQIINGSVLARTKTTADHAAGILAAAGESLELLEIQQRMRPRRSAGTLVNALGADERFVRTNRTKWALASWEVEAYTSIRQKIGHAVEQAGGSIELELLVQQLTTKFSVAATSVNAYASAGEFEVLEGMVRRRQNPAAPQKSPEDTRRLFRHHQGWRYRIVVNRDHLRGSGFTLPTGLATAVGCTPGAVVEFTSRLGRQTMRWTGLQPACGTIRRFLEDIGAREGQIVFLEFASDGQFDVLPFPEVDSSADPLQMALVLVGTPPASSHQTLATLAFAVGLDTDTKPRRILSAYRRRGDDEVVEVLERAWVLPQASRASTSVDPG